MRRVATAGTAPEMAVRRYLHSHGLRYALNRRDLPGRPDLVLARRGTVVFVHGCFWHGHDCRHGAVRAKTNAAYWSAKIQDNRERDARQCKALKVLGWKVEVIWECECTQTSKLRALVARLSKR